MGNRGKRAAVALAAVLATLATGPVYAAPSPPGGGDPGGGQRPSGSIQPSSPPSTSEEPPSLPKTTVLPGPLPDEPPPVDSGLTPSPPDAAPAPDFPYKKGTQCVRSSVTGPGLPTRPWAQDSLRVDDVHKFVTGKGQKVAVIDTGVHRHPFLQNRVQAGGDYVDSAFKGVDDCDGHGTIVAGIIAANTDPDGTHPNIGFDGMAPDANILSIRQTSKYYKTGDDSRPTAGTLDTLAKAVAYAASQGVGVINISLTSCIPKNSTSIAASYRVLQAAIDYAVNKKDAVVVAAAGNLDPSPNGCSQQNDNPDPDEVSSVPLPPWFSDDVLSVGSIGKNGDPSPFSIAGPWVSVAAPGDQIISLDPAGNALVNQKAEEPNAQPGPIEGTSFAAPYVSGLAALVRQKFPNLNAHQVMHRIEATAQHPAAAGGRDNEVGHGMINPVGALTMEVPGEQGSVQPAQAENLPANLPLPYEKDWTPTIVALAGTGAGFFLLVLTVFIMRTVQRNRRRRGDGTTGR
jgi:membrane-anchored mycosin MYCP